jgi:hypothetical protein
MYCPMWHGKDMGQGATGWINTSSVCLYRCICDSLSEIRVKNWVILSAKYGFLYPEELINEPYNVSFIKPSDKTIGLKALKEQAKQKELCAFNEIVYWAANITRSG